jgi:hypothetical protein
MERSSQKAPPHAVDLRPFKFASTTAASQFRAAIAASASRSVAACSTSTKPPPPDEADLRRDEELIFYHQNRHEVYALVCSNLAVNPGRSGSMMRQERPPGSNCNMLWPLTTCRSFSISVFPNPEFRRGVTAGPSRSTQSRSSVRCPSRPATVQLTRRRPSG